MKIFTGQQDCLDDPKKQLCTTHEMFHKGGKYYEASKCLEVHRRVYRGLHVPPPRAFVGALWSRHRPFTGLSQTLKTHQNTWFLQVQNFLTATSIVLVWVAPAGVLLRVGFWRLLGTNLIGEYRRWAPQRGFLISRHRCLPRKLLKLQWLEKARCAKSMMAHTNTPNSQTHSTLPN